MSKKPYFWLRGKAWQGSTPTLRVQKLNGRSIRTGFKLVESVILLVHEDNLQ